MIYLFEVLLIVACLLGTAFFAGMETGVISIHRLRLRHLARRKVRGAMILQDFLDHPGHLLGTTLAGTNVCTVVASVTAASLAVHYLGAWGSPLSSVVMTLILLICCEYIPKAWFQSDPARRAIPFASTLHFAGYIFYPISVLVTAIANLLIPSHMHEQPHTTGRLTYDDLRYLTREGEQSGALSAQERRMIHGVFELIHKRCEEIMIPLSDLVMVRADTERKALLKLARSRNVTRLPVYEDEPSHVIGILHIMDVAARPESDRGTARDYMRPPQFVPHDTLVDDILPRMRLSRQPMALICDDKSHVVGMVTLEDALAEVVGTI